LKILEKIDRVPGGIILVPMLVTAIIRTIAPGALSVGGITTMLFSTYGTQVFIGALLFLAGSQFRVQDVPKALGRSGVLLISKIIIAVALTAVFLGLFGSSGVFGISALAFCITALSLNPGTFLAVVTEHGDTIDPPGFGLYNLVVVPAMPAVVLGVLDGAAFDYMSIVTTLVPFLLGMLLGNLDEDLRKLFGGATRPMLFFAGCDFGAAVDLVAAVHTGLSGLLLSGCYILLCGGLMLLVDRKILKQPGYGSASLSCVAGASVSMPALVAQTLPQYAPYADAATGQIACCVVVTTVFSCFFTRWLLKRNGDKRSVLPEAPAAGEQ
jgi:2-keto-3-deoxygluconate permease